MTRDDTTQLYRTARDGLFEICAILAGATSLFNSDSALNRQHAHRLLSIGDRLCWERLGELQILALEMDLDA